MNSRTWSLHHFRIALMCIAMAAPLFAQDPPVIEALKKGQPREVASFIHRVFLCHHWAGEEPYSKARAEEIHRAITELRCDRLETDEVRLRRKYRRNPKVLKALDAVKAS